MNLLCCAIFNYNLNVDVLLCANVVNGRIVYVAYNDICMPTGPKVSHKVSQRRNFFNFISFIQRELLKITLHLKRCDALSCELSKKICH